MHTYARVFMCACISMRIIIAYYFSYKEKSDIFTSVDKNCITFFCCASCVSCNYSKKHSTADALTIGQVELRWHAVEG